MCPEVACRDDIPPEAVKAAVFEDPALSSFGAGGFGVYRSGFHENGTLVYEPLAKSGRGFFDEALLSRMMWGAALGLGDGEVKLNGEIPPRAREWQQELEALEGIYKEGAKAALGILDAFSRRPIDQQKIMSLAGEIERTEEKIRTLDNGLGPLRAFHQHHIMDMDRVNYPELARLFASKYFRMLGATESFKGVLGRVLQEEERQDA
jgi:hypothetical protein